MDVPAKIEVGFTAPAGQGGWTQAQREAMAEAVTAAVGAAVPQDHRDAWGLLTTDVGANGHKPDRNSDGITGVFESMMAVFEEQDDGVAAKQEPKRVMYVHVDNIRYAYHTYELTLNGSDWEVEHLGLETNVVAVFSWPTSISFS